MNDGWIQSDRGESWRRGAPLLYECVRRDGNNVNLAFNCFGFWVLRHTVLTREQNGAITDIILAVYLLPQARKSTVEKGPVLFTYTRDVNLFFFHDIITKSWNT